MGHGDARRSAPGDRGARGAVTAGAPGTPTAYGPLAERAAAHDCTILVTGETGVGKGHFAKWVHARSGRAGRPFVPVNCGAIPDSLVDSQLFGHARGAFSGATREHPGLVRAADGGTLFLDEVGELPPGAQMRLLRLLQEREVQPVGYDRPVLVDVRVVAATNVDLHEAVRERRFREDLLFRLDVVRIPVPPLRERRDEIPALAERFNREFATMYRQPAVRFTDGARERLRGHAWPGNVRQLRTVLERLHVLAPDQVVDESVLERIGQLRPTARVAPRTLGDLRAGELRRVLDEHGGSVSRAAAVFGVHRSTIYRWLAEAGEAAPPAGVREAR